MMSKRVLNQKTEGMESLSSLDITEKVKQTEAKIQRWHNTYFWMSMIWMITIPALLGLYTYFHGLNPAVLGFCLAGYASGVYCGGFVMVDKIFKSWFRRSYDGEIHGTKSEPTT